MPQTNNIRPLEERIFLTGSSSEFNGLALEIFHYQLGHNALYRKYALTSGRARAKPLELSEIPFLPIGFFKTHEVKCGDFQAEKVFLSSGTGGMSSSRHFVRDARLYSRSYMQGFRHFYGDPAGYSFLGLLPSYLEREGSSLIEMVKGLMDSSASPHNGFYLYEHEALAAKLKDLSAEGRKTMLFGVSFALLDFAERYPMPLTENILIMETGGMKGRRKEIIRPELHHTLKEAFGLGRIHSEYGMTELLSQAWSVGEGRFRTPPWMKVMIRDIQDPYCFLPPGKSGAINIIDLANLHSCAFIETQDIGKLHEDGSFEVLGRTDTSDIRGCSLLIS